MINNLARPSWNFPRQKLVAKLICVSSYYLVWSKNWYHSLYSRKNCILELTSSKVRSISKSKTTNEENRHYIKRENNGIMETVEKINDTKILIEVVRLPFKFRASFILPLVGINCTTSEVFRGIYFLLCHHAKG